MDDLATLEAKRQRLRAELETLNHAKPGSAERRSNLEAGVETVDRQLEERREWERLMATADGDPSRSRTPAADFNVRTAAPTPTTFIGQGAESSRQCALRSVAARADVLCAADGDRLDSLIRRDRSGADSAVIAAASSPHYESAIFKKLTGGDGPATVLSPEEGRALETMGEAEVQRSMVEGTGSLGGFGIPISIDPSVIATGDGTVSPLRELADVRTATSLETRMVAASGVVAEWLPEGQESSEALPNLSQPVIKVQKASCFIQATHELFDDWSALREELLRMFGAAKNNLESVAFLSGDGEDKPYGLLVGATTGKVEAASVTQAALEEAQAALPPAFQPTSRWLTNLATRNGIDQLVPEASTEAAKFIDANGNILHKGWAEASDMPEATTGKTPVALGDFRAAYRIYDRLASGRIELIQNLMGENRRPLAARGMFFTWRVGGKCVNPNAIRLIELE